MTAETRRISAHPYPVRQGRSTMTATRAALSPENRNLRRDMVMARRITGTARREAARAATPAAKEGRTT